MKKNRFLSTLVAAGALLLLLAGLFQVALAQTYTITKVITPPGGGTVTLNPDKPSYSGGEPITLTAVSNPGYVFAGWTDSTGQFTDVTDNPALYEVTESATITAEFTKLVVCYTLTRNVSPLASGSISASSDLTDEACAPNSYPEGAIVTLEATAADGYQFSSWTGATPSGTDPKTATVVMTANRDVTANFSARCQTLSLSHAGLGADPVANPVNSTGCPAGQYKLGEVITLTAQPLAGWRVAGWTGTDNNGSTSVTNQVTMPALPAAQTTHSVVVTYIQRPTLQFAAQTFQANENDGTATITVTRTGSKTEAVTVDYDTGAPGDTAVPGVDYTSASGTLNFAANIEATTFTVDLIDNNLPEGPVELTLKLSNQTAGAILGTPNEAKLRILDDEDTPQVQFSLSDYEVDESAGAITVNVNLVPAPPRDVYVDFRTQGVTAVAGEDYTPVGEDQPRVLRFRFSAGQTSKNVTIGILDDALDERNETVQLILDNIDGAELGLNATAVLTILDDDEAPSVQLGAGEYFIKQGPSSFALPVSLSAVSGQTVNVGYEITLARNGAMISGTLVFDPGTTTQDIVLSLVGTSDGDQFTIQLQDVVNVSLGEPNSAILYILDTDITDCHELIFTNTGYGEAPAPANKNSSLGCPSGQYVANEQINVVAQPAKGWYVERWQGTANDLSKALENTVLMPDGTMTVNADYRVPVFFSVTYGPVPVFEGPDEVEPNNLFAIANGPLVHNRTYRGGFPDNSDTEDRFFFNLSVPSRVTVTLDSMADGQDYNLYIYPENWASGFLGYSGRVGNLKETITRDLEPGKYFIRVSYASGEPTTDKYELNFVVE